MYTRIANGLLKVLTVLGVIAALIAGVAAGTATRYDDAISVGIVGIGVFILALIIIGILLLFFGMFVELANNILDIKICLDKWNSSQGNKPSQASQATQVRQASQATRVEEVVEERVEKEAPEEQTKPAQKKAKPKTEWFCSACGVKNEPQALYCTSCGKHKQFLEK